MHDAITISLSVDCPWQSGAEVQLTLFRLPEIDEVADKATFQRDADWARGDLVALKALAETWTPDGQR